LANDAKVSAEGSGFRSISLAHNVASLQEVDSVMTRAIEAGATMLKKPEKTSWGGYSGYFADPDGFLWEVAHNPFWQLSEDGRVSLAMLFFCKKTRVLHPAWQAVFSAYDAVHELAFFSS